MSAVVSDPVSRELHKPAMEFIHPADAAARPLRILAVDDCALMRELVGFTLRSAGLRVVKALDGRQALRLAQQQRFDLVLADLHMPDMDGLELVRALRALPDYRFTPIMMLTGESDQGRLHEAKDAGASGWITKPFTPEHLLALIRRVQG